MGKGRYIEGRGFFVKVTVVLRDGRTLTGIDDTVVSDIDANWHVYLGRVKEKWGSKIDTFQVVQLSRHDPEVAQHIKSRKIHISSQVADEHAASFEEMRLADDAKKHINRLPVKRKWQPGKYRS